MINDFRRRAAACLPGGAFLRRDRADALFVTDAPRFEDERPVCDRLIAAGFSASAKNGLIRIRADISMMMPYEALPAPDEFCRTLLRFAGLPVQEEQIDLFNRIVREQDGDKTVQTEILLRKRAAVCLRAGGGGGLYACAVLAHKRGVYE